MNWYVSSNEANGNWNSIASDSTGKYLIASSPFTSLNGVYLSDTSGVTWTAASTLTNSGPTSFVSVASDSTGQYLAVCNGINATSGSDISITGIFTSSDYGVNWSLTSAGNNSWTSIASNSTGQYLIACASTNSYSVGTSGIYVSNDYGSTWAISYNSSQQSWSSVASNSSGQYLFAVSNDGQFLASISYGASWSYGFSSSQFYTGVASDSTGQYVVVCANNSPDDYIYTSDNSGVSFSQSSAPPEYWTGVASDSTGQNLVAVIGNISNGGIYNSTNGGSTWTKSTSAPDTINWYSVASDSTGTILAAAAIGDGGLYNTTACFLEGSKILTSEGYIPIENLKRGDLIKTFNGDFIPIIMLGKKEIYHSASEERIEDQLYKCCQDKYPEIFEDLIITGRHSVLVEEFIDENQKERTRKVNNGILTIENKYRLPSCADERAVVYETPGTYTIYHFALENEDDYLLHGIYANGLLVETTSKHYLRELSEMTLY